MSQGTSDAEPLDAAPRTAARYGAPGSPFRKMLTGAALFILVCVAAVIGYMAAGWAFTDALYMVVITIFGVGYGEVQPVQSPSLRALTIMVIIAGYGAVIYTVGGFMQLIVDGELNRALGARRMTKDINRLQNHTIICGMGRMGAMLARDLQAAGRPFVVIDTDPSRTELAAESGYLFIQGDASEEEVLAHAGIERAAVLATVLSQDAANVFITITARELNPSVLIIARGENPRTEKKLYGCGANRVVLPTAIGAAKVAQLIIRPSAENMLERLTQSGSMHDELGQIGLEFAEFEVAEDSPLKGRQIREIDIQRNQLLIVGVRHASGEVELDPQPEQLLATGDVIITLGHASQVPEISQLLSMRVNQITYRGVTTHGA